MNNEEIAKLATSLAKAETEKEVVNLLREIDYWSRDENWKDLDENDGNWSVGGNQQSGADSALVEKIINSVDAVLIRECLKEGLRPDSVEAPKSIAEAQKRYFDIHDGKLSNVDATRRTHLAENINLIVSAKAGSNEVNPSYTIFDFGEGQAPENFPHTFLSLTKSNKARVQFVQGKFGMGGTGIFRFGSPENNLQLIISKRNPLIKNEKLSTSWGMTVIKRVPPTGNMRSSVLRYLAPQGKILSFSSESLPLLPTESEKYAKSIEYGTFIKIYEYELGTGRLRSDATRHLYNRLSLLMPNIALPIKIYDTRFAKSPVKTLSGLSVRLDEDKRENLEIDFPGSGELTTRGQIMGYSIYAFRAGKRDTYAGDEGIIFTVNGQTHGSLSKSFFQRKTVGMSYLSDSILILVDCTKLDRGTQEKLFMNSRDRLAGGPLQDEIESELEEVVRNHPGLKALREKRRREDIENKLQDSKPLADVLENILKKSPSLASLFKQGVRIKSPFNLIGASEEGKFKGVKYPTYFTPTKEYSKEKPKLCPINKKFRVQFETDAKNNYFSRDKDAGEFILQISSAPLEGYSLNLWNGLATLSITLPQDVEIGDLLNFKTSVTDHTKVEPILSDFFVKVTEVDTKQNGNGGDRKNSSGKEAGEKRKKESSLALPNAIPVRRDEWVKYGFNEKSALKIMDAGENEGYDFFINMDNVYLQMEIKGNAKLDPRLLEARFKYGMVLVGISMLNFEEKERKATPENKERGDSVYERISDFSKAMAPTLLPMIAELGNLEIEE